MILRAGPFAAGAAPPPPRKASLSIIARLNCRARSPCSAGCFAMLPASLRPAPDFDGHRSAPRPRPDRKGRPEARTGAGPARRPNSPRNSPHAGSNRPPPRMQNCAADTVRMCYSRRAGRAGVRMPHSARLRLAMRSSYSGERAAPKAVLRSWKPGDRVHLRYSSGPRKVKEVLERMKVTGEDRSRLAGPRSRPAGSSGCGAWRSSRTRHSALLSNRSPAQSVG